MLRKKLIAYRRQEGISQLQLAEKLGVSRQTIVRWENGVNNPSEFELKKIADLMNVSEKQLLYEDIDDEKRKVSNLEEIVNDISYGVSEQRKVLEDISAKQITAEDLEALRKPFDNSKEQLEVQKAILRQKKVRTGVLIVLAILILIIVGIFIYGISFYADDTNVLRKTMVYTDED